MCGLAIEHNGKEILSIRGDKADPFSKGSICPKGASIDQLYNDPNRLKKPLRKQADGSFQEISWKAALDEVGEKINAVRTQYGDDAVALYLGNPTVHNFGMMLYSGEFRRILNTKNLYTPTTMDQLPHHFTGYYMYGHAMTIPVPDIDRTDYMVIFGANPMASNGSLMSSCGVHSRITAIKNRGGKVILIDPRNTETGKVVSEHLFIRPSKDVYFLLGMLHLIQKNNWIKLGHLEGHINGLEKLDDIAAEFSPEKVASLTGIPAETLHRITKEYVLAERAVLYGRMGMSTQEHGGLCHWLVGIINMLTGHFDKEGGAMFAKSAVDIIRSKKFHKAHGRWKSRVRGLAEFDGELPVAGLAEEMLTPGEGQVKAFITYAGNPVLSTPNSKRLETALPQLDFMVSIDIYLNETTRHADIILPPPSHLEIEHYDLIFNAISVSNNVKYSQPLFEPEEGQLKDWEIAKELIKRFAKVAKTKPSPLFKWFTPKTLLNLALLSGPYGKLSSPSKLFSGLSLQKVIDSKHGIRLGALAPRIPEVLRTPDYKINIADDVFMEGLAAIKKTFEKDMATSLAANEFLLIGRRHLRSNNSWMHNVPKLMRGKNRCTMMIHPTDAEALQIKAEQIVTVISVTGSLQIPVEITDTIMPKVISIPHGFGHDKKGSRLDVASAPENAGVSVNAITDHNRIDTVTGNAAFSGQKVIVELITPTAI